MEIDVHKKTYTAVARNDARECTRIMKGVWIILFFRSKIAYICQLESIDYASLGLVTTTHSFTGMGVSLFHHYRQIKSVFSRQVQL